MSGRSKSLSFPDLLAGNPNPLICCWIGLHTGRGTASRRFKEQGRPSDWSFDLSDSIIQNSRITLQISHFNSPAVESQRGKGRKEALNVPYGIS